MCGFFFSYRFDELGVELFPDSDRLSYTSLSRSSSLIQFESLERQLQSDSQISGSSPSIYSYEGVNSSGPVTHTSQVISEKSASVAIHLPTIKVSNPPPSTIQFTNSDSEPFSSSSTSGSFSSDDSEILREKKIVVNDSSLSSTASDEKAIGSVLTNTPLIKSTENRKKYLNGFRAKNSVDSLSEDSGYCDRERAGALSLDSSLPTGNDLEDEDGNVIEEKSIAPMRTFLLTPPRVRSHSDDDDICYHSMENLNRRFKSRKIDLLSEINVESTISRKPNATTTKSLKIESPSAHVPTEHKTMVKNKNEENSLMPQSEKIISISLPELSASSDISRRSRSKLKRNYRQSCDEFNDQFSSVSSVPDHINLSSERGDISDFSWTEPCESIASKNFNLYDLNYGPSVKQQQPQKIVDISASCANLTLLNYSEESEFCYDPRKLISINRSKSQTMSGKLPVNAFSSDDEDDDAYIATYRSKELSTLLEEISAHFDKNLSILNDRERSYEPPQKVSEIKNVQTMKTPPPKPPPRRTQIKTSPNHSAPKASETFDRDPTNLTTSYAQSLEKCNFNVDEPVNVYSSRQNLYLTVDEAKKSTPIQKRNFVSSTPNLNYFDFEMKHVNHYSSTDNTVGNDLLSPSFAKSDEDRCTSMKEIPSNSRAGSTGILASHSTAGSKGGLSVSFCPIVSEISWQENVEDEEFSDDVDMDPSGEGFSGARNDSLVNYYNNNDDDDDEDFDDFIAVGTSTAEAVFPSVGDLSAQTHSQVNDENIQPQTIINVETLTPRENEAISKAESIQEIEVLAESDSQKMLVETQTSSEKLIAAEASVGSMDKKVNSQTLTTVPHKVASEPSIATTKGAKNKKSIFSRLSSGLRFSFRGKKNKKISNDGVVHYPPESNNNTGSKAEKSRGSKVEKTQKNGAKTIDGDFVFIPLKDPNDNVRNFQVDDKQLSNAQQQKVQTRSPQQQQQQLSVDRQRSSPPKSGSQVTGKPPLPKLPPRIVGTTTKRPSTHAQSLPRASSTPREYDADGGEFYDQSMIGDGLKQQYYSGGSRTMGTLGSEHKIGLIETNLDTDETIINGKTQSLMELGIGQNVGNRVIMNRIAGMGGVQVMQNVNSVNGGVNVETGRPHKSMEFLLDKENHQRVLVSEIFLVSNNFRLNKTTADSLCGLCFTQTTLFFLKMNANVICHDVERKVNPCFPHVLG